jgi:hypothetical protein
MGHLMGQFNVSPVSLTRPTSEVEFSETISPFLKTGKQPEVAESMLVRTFTSVRNIIQSNTGSQ